MTDLQQKMQAVYDTDPTIGKKRMMKATGCGSGTAQRFLEKKRGKNKPPAPPDKYAFLDSLPAAEVDRLRQSILSAPAHHTPKPVTWAKSSFKFAAIADSHIGHVFSHRAWWDKVCDLVAREKCDFALHVGDICEGMSGRPGHFYELDRIGMDAQVKESVERLKQFPVKVKGITGNHDLWAYKNVGADPGAMIAAQLPDKFEYLGQNESTIEVSGIKIMLSHPGDGSSYAVSYSSQKFVESLSGGEKPHILLMGHHHKSIFHQCRNVATFECGTLCGQTGWMRGKKLAAHCGFWIIEVWPSKDGGIERLKPEWIPFFT